MYPDIAEDVYRAWPLPHYSLLAKFRDPDNCELDIKDAIDGAYQEEATDQMNFGRLVEQAVDCPDALGAGVHVLPQEIKARRGAAWQELQRQNPSIEFLPPSEFAKHTESMDKARKIAESVRAHELVGPVIAAAERQVSFVADLSFAGASGEIVTHRVKGRVDYLIRGEGIIADLKTSAFGDPRRVGAAMWQRALDIQSALYTDAIASILGKEFRFYFFMARTNRRPIVTVYNGHNTTEMAGHFLSVGRRAYQVYLERLRECQTTGKWRGYFSDDAPDLQVLDVHMPAWAE